MNVNTFKIRTFDEVEVEKISWFWEPFIAFGKITVIQGDPGNGKTTFALALAALFSQKQPMPTGSAPAFAGNVLYQSGEDNPQDTIKPRLLACGADCSKIAFLEAEGKITADLLEEAIRGTNAKYVVLDPLQAFLTETQDISRTKNMRPLLRGLGNVAARTGAAIIIIGHMNKGEKKGIYRGLGSIDITAAARSVLLIGKRKNDPETRFITQIKNNLSPFGRAVSFTICDNGKVEFGGECDISEDDLLDTRTQRKSKIEIAKGIVSSLMASGDVRSNEIYSACFDAGVGENTIQSVKKNLGIKSVKKTDDWYWSSGESIEADDEVPFVPIEERLQLSDFVPVLYR